MEGPETMHGCIKKMQRSEVEERGNVRMTVSISSIYTFTLSLLQPSSPERH